MTKKLEKIISLCSTINEKDTCDVYGDKYKVKDVLDYVRKFDPDIITLCDALGFLKNANLRNEFKRVMKDKDKSYNY